jgi:hypothetical protein
LASIQLAERNLRRHSGRYLIVRYEDLAARPEETLRAVCAFIDEPYLPALLQARPSGDGRGADRAASGQGDRGGPDDQGAQTRWAATVGAFRDVMPLADLTFMEAQAGRAMAVHGYPLERVRLPAGERLAYHLRDLPLNLTRLLAWRSRERIDQLLPPRLARPPAWGKVRLSEA